jgi:hypothetical protein
LINTGSGSFVDQSATPSSPGDLDLVVGNSGVNGEERVFVTYPCAHGRCDARP